MKVFQSTRKGTDKLGNTYKRVTTQDCTSENPKLTITYFFNGKKVTKYDGWLVQEWFINNNWESEISKELK
tara:strand:- start:533 stop:745 length:213 start_codon:yes stop_codon:yes gene_type:complete